MITFNLLYTGNEEISKFIAEHNIVDSPGLLIQIFTAKSDKKLIEFLINNLNNHLPQSKIFGVSTSGFIINDQLFTENTVLSFTIFKESTINILYNSSQTDYEIGSSLSESLNKLNSNFIFLYTIGEKINGNKVLAGLNSNKNFFVVGGNFCTNNSENSRFIFTNNYFTSHGAIAVSLTNKNIEASIDYNCSWQKFDQKNMIVTESRNNRLYSLDGIPVKDIYKNYFGENFFDNFLEKANSIPFRLEKNDENGMKFVLGIADFDKDFNYIELMSDIEEGEVTVFAPFNKISFYRILERIIAKLSHHNIELCFIFYDKYRAKQLDKVTFDNELTCYKLLSDKTLGLICDGQYYSSSDPIKSYFYSHSCTQAYLTETPQLYKQSDIKNIKDINSFINNVVYANEDQEFRALIDIILGKERLLSIGQLIGGIAHNLNTPLASIAGIIYIINKKFKELQEKEISNVDNLQQDYSNLINFLSEKISLIERNALYMTDIVQAVQNQITNSSSNHDNKFTLGNLFRKLELLMSYQFKQNKITFNKYINEDTNYIEISGELSAMLQVLINLVDNAIYSYYGKGGIINIGSSLDYNDKTKECFVKIYVEDFGCGINDSIKEKLFNQMVTTKGANGSGIGLFLTQTIIKAKFNGMISINKLRTDGTTVEIMIPLFMDFKF